MSNIEFEKIVRQFFKEEFTQKPIPFGSGHINDTFKFSIESGENEVDFILQRVNQNVFKEPEGVMENIQKIADYLFENDYPKKILKPVLTQNNQPFFETNAGDVWRVFPFFKNTFTIDKVKNEAQAFEAARAFGEYLNYLKNMDLTQIKTTIPNFHNGVLRMRKFEKILQHASPNRIDMALPEIRFVIDHHNIFERIANLKLPIRITHNDTKINNVLFDKNTQKAVAVIDLDTLMPGIILSDFGDMVRTFTNSTDEDEADLSKVEFRKDIFDALKVGFLSEMKGLEEIEIKHLFEGAKWITLMQVLRFLTDFLEGDIYYKTKYPNHNLVRTRNQIAFFKSMVKK